MNKRNGIGKSQLNEINQGRYADIKKAINKVLRVRISYNDKQGGKGKNERYILPVAFGLTKSGKPAVRAYQTAGSSKRGLTNPPNPRPIPKWKLFLVDNIYSWSNGSKSFKDYKDALIKLGLNTHGDKGMTKLFAITPFADDDVQVAKDTSTNPMTAQPLTKSDVEPTRATQSPKTTEPEKFEPAGNSRKQSVDINPKPNYTKDRLEAPETAPITKPEVGPKQPEITGKDEVDKMEADGTTPISKDDISGAESKEEVTSKFNDMMNRMDNLYKDEEDEENANK
jgi:hypothetical protein